MAAEIQPPEAPTASTLSTDVAATDTEGAILAATATLPTTLTITVSHHYTENAGPPLAPKRQRRPSVRLGEIGDQPATLAYESLARRPNKHPWRLQKYSTSAPSSKVVKARSLTNLVNGGDDSLDNQEFEERNHHNLDGNSEFGYRKAKSKRAITTKRVRSNWVSRVDDGAEGDSRDDGDEGFRDLDPNSESPLKVLSPLHSVDNAALDMWHGQRKPVARHRVTSTRENEVDNLLESDSRDWKCETSERVRSWLIELGLGRYAPMFEIHEVDDEVLPLLTLEDLKDMGINAVGSRRKMYTAIQKLRRGFL